MKKKSVTIYDIAQRLKLSPSTVSRGLRNDDRINADTRKLIGDAARSMNYQPNRVAAGLRGGSTTTIGVMVPRINRHFFANAISGIERVARARGYQVIITQSHESVVVERENLVALTSARVDGIIASVTIETQDTPHFDGLIKRAFPLVFFDRVGRGLASHRVLLDDRQSARRAVAHLIEEGATRIAHMSGPQHSNVYRDRYEGYHAALIEANLPFEEAYVVENCLTEDRGYEEIVKLLALPQPPDAIFAASDFPTIGIYRFCRENGIRIPEDLAIVSFANEPFTQIVEPAISTVEQFSEQMGAAAAELLFRQIDSKEAVLPVQEIIIPGALRVRDSSRRAAVPVPK